MPRALLSSAALPKTGYALKMLLVFVWGRILPATFECREAFASYHLASALPVCATAGQTNQPRLAIPPHQLPGAHQVTDWKSKDMHQSSERKKKYKYEGIDHVEFHGHRQMDHWCNIGTE